MQILRASRASQGRFQTECLVLYEFQFRFQSTPSIPKHPQASPSLFGSKGGLPCGPTHRALDHSCHDAGPVLPGTFDRAQSCAIVQMCGQLRTVADSGADSCIVFREVPGLRNALAIFDIHINTHRLRLIDTDLFCSSSIASDLSQTFCTIIHTLYTYVIVYFTRFYCQLRRRTLLRYTHRASLHICMQKCIDAFRETVYNQPYTT